MKVFTEVNPESITNIYFVTDNEQKYGVIIDPGSFAENVYRLIKQTGAEIKKIIITHNDYDQIAGIPVIKKIYDADIYAYSSKILNFDAQKIMNGSIIEEGDLKFKIIETPIYSYDSISILSEDTLFVGDMFQAGSFTTFNDKKAPSVYEYEIIKKHILSLPDHIIIYPSKGPATTVELERKYNPYFHKIIEQENNLKNE